MARMQESRTSNGALVCLGLVIHLASCVLATSIGKTDYELFHQLNDPSLTADEVLSMLEDRRSDKDGRVSKKHWLGPYSVDAILFLSKDRIENCDALWQRKFLAMQKTFISRECGLKDKTEFDWNAELNYGANYGLARFVNHYLSKVIQYCADNAGEVLKRALDAIEASGRKRIDNLTKEFACDLEKKDNEELIKCADKYLKSKDASALEQIANDCRDFTERFSFPKQFKGTFIAGRELPGALGNQIRAITTVVTRARRVCETILRARNGDKGPFIDEQPPKSHSEASIRSESMPNELYEASSSVEQVDTILEATEDKDQVCLGNLTVRLILTIKLHSTDNCFTDKLSTFELAKQLSSEAFPHSGLDKFCQHHWTELIRYCGQHIGHIIEGQELTVESRHRETIAELVSHLEAGKRVTVREVSTALSKMTETLFEGQFHQDQIAQSIWRLSDLENSCKDFGTQYKYLQELQENRSGKLSDQDESNLQTLLRAKYACQIYLDDRNMLSPSAIINKQKKMK